MKLGSTTLESNLIRDYIMEYIRTHGSVTRELLRISAYDPNELMDGVVDGLLEDDVIEVNSDGRFTLPGGVGTQG